MIAAARPGTMLGPKRREAAFALFVKHKRTRRLEGTAVFLNIPVLIYFRAFCLWKMYGWYLLPLGAPAISQAHVLGLTVIGLIAFKPIPEDRPRSRKPVLYKLIAPYMYNSLGLLTAWIITWWL